ncbi:MAG: DNA ligase D [Gemmatimonadaceae bacterium]
MPDRPDDDNLRTYREKRSADRSPEPLGTVASDEGRLFVVHKHAARRLHWDLRLEMDGVLQSWAVPKGPSYDTNDKRLAVKVEDHPLDYGDFEGVIPEGNYGAGGIIVWDRGEWVPLEDFREGLVTGKLLFELKGYKLHGKWTLVKIKKSEKEWLLIKERDSWVKKPGDEFPEESVLSGLTVEELQAGDTPASKVRKALEKEQVERKRVDPRDVQLTLAELREGAFTRDGWIFELKLDGYRLLAAKSKGEALLLTRNGNDYTGTFPEVAKAIKALPFDSGIVDGEVVVLDDSGKPSFAMLQQRGRLTSPRDVRRAAVELPAAFFVFDLIAFEDFDLRSLPQTRRKELLADLTPKLGAVRYLSHIEREGEEFLTQVSAMGLEGIIAKKADAPYRAGRNANWLKIKAEKTGDFVIVGFTQPRGNRSGLGALQLGDYVDGQLVYAGRAGTGLSDKLLRDLRKQLEPLVRGNAPCLGPVVKPNAEPLPKSVIPETKTTTWVEPQLVCEVRFREWTPDGVLRHPAFLRMRDDKSAEECQRQGWQNDPDVAGEAGPNASSENAQRTKVPPPQRIAPDKTIKFSNLSKIFWPAERYTKGDLIEYYRSISPWILPYLRNRPVVMTRFPDGIEGKSFYQKDAPEFAPEWIRTVGIWSEDTQREIQYFVCDDEESLLYIANLGTIPLHIWMSRVDSLTLPDWCVIDLDPKDAPFKDVIKSAQVLHRICQEIALPDYVKTTGKSGLHILLPLAEQLTFEQTRTLGELLARLVIKELPNSTTITRHVTKRGDKVYLDYLQNRTGQLIVAPFSVRPLPGAAVSMPLEWDEVDQSLDPRAFTIKTAPERMEKMGKDPVRQVLGDTPDLLTVLAKLSAMLSG